jgi:hypothetical protein
MVSATNKQTIILSPTSREFQIPQCQHAFSSCKINHMVLIGIRWRENLTYSAQDRYHRFECHLSLRSQKNMVEKTCTCKIFISHLRNLLSFRDLMISDFRQWLAVSEAGRHFMEWGFANSLPISLPTRAHSCLSAQCPLIHRDVVSERWAKGLFQVFYTILQACLFCF